MIPVTTLTLADTAATEALGKRLAAWLTPGKTVYLRGELGAGKTTLVRGLLRALGHQGAVKSPTYTLIEPYEFQNFSVFHCDFHRISDPFATLYLLTIYIRYQRVPPKVPHALLPIADI